MSSRSRQAWTCVSLESRFETGMNHRDMTKTAMERDDDNPYRPPESPAGATIKKVVAPAHWCSIASLICSIGSIVVHAFALSYASRAITAATGVHAQPVDLTRAIGGLDALGFALLIGALLAGIPATVKDKNLRSIVLIAFVGAVVFSLLLV
jgi:hypothetical protein